MQHISSVVPVHLKSLFCCKSLKIKPVISFSMFRVLLSPSAIASASVRNKNVQKLTAYSLLNRPLNNPVFFSFNDSEVAQ